MTPLLRSATQLERATLGQRLAFVRIESGISQEALARALGVSRSAVAQWETDRADPTYKHLVEIAKHLRVNINLLPNKGTATMAFAIRDLSVLAYANGFTLWHQKAGNDSLVAVSADGYFDEASDMMAKGDMILVSAENGCRMLAVVRAENGKVLTAPVG